MAGIQMVQDHVIHFYHLHALDWVDVTSALKADPAKTATLAQSISNWPNSSPTYFKAVLDRITALADSGQLSLFTSGYWGHPAYQLPPEANLMAVAHYIEALDWQRDVIRIHAVLGGKNPHPQTYLVGGMATGIDPNSPDAAINPERIDFMTQLVTSAKNFVEQVYVPDVLAVASFYPEWFSIGEGLGNFMAYGDYPGGGINDPATFLFPRGIIMNRDLSTVQSICPGQDLGVRDAFVVRVLREVTALGSTRRSARPVPSTAGRNHPTISSNTDQKYSWLKSPRYDGNAMEVGPLARTLVAYASGVEGIKTAVDGVLQKLNAQPSALFSTLGRVAARAIERSSWSASLQSWLDDLSTNMNSGNLEMHNGSIVGSELLAEVGARNGDARSSARSAGALGRDREQEGEELSGGRSEHLERGPARRERHPGAPTRPA